VAHFLKTGERLSDPSPEEQMATVLEHYDAILSHYGTENGVRMARKHLGWYARGFHGAAEFRGRVVTLPDPHQVREAIRSAWSNVPPQQKAA
jgi:tRNA-dihydrouridine synthase B